MRFDLNGDGIHNDGGTGTGHIGDMGAPTDTATLENMVNCGAVGLCGYELARSLNFSVGASYRNASANMDGLTSGTGWAPIGMQLQ